jgi:hypothetical protein
MENNIEDPALAICDPKGFSGRLRWGAFDLSDQIIIAQTLRSYNLSKQSEVLANLSMSKEK